MNLPAIVRVDIQGPDLSCAKVSDPVTGLPISGVRGFDIHADVREGPQIDVVLLVDHLSFHGNTPARYRLGIDDLRRVANDMGFDLRPKTPA